MNELELIISLFPLVFIFHEFEEIICFKHWISENGWWLKEEFPRIARQVTHLEQLSVPAFAMAVLEESIIVGVITALSLTLNWYSVWIAAFTVFAFHILLHIAQWIVIRKYIPVIITSLLSVPYIAWGLYKILYGFSLSMIMICFAIGLLIAILNLYFAHKFAIRYDKIIKVTSVPLKLGRIKN